MYPQQTSGRAGQVLEAFPASLRVHLPCNGPLMLIIHHSETNAANQGVTFGMSN